MSLDIDCLTVPGALDRVSFSVADGEIVAIIGPSGSGKTTLLHTIAGFVSSSGGTMHIDDDDITSRPVQQRSTGVMFERPTLFDMTVEQNIEFALDDARQSEKQRHDLVSIVMSSLNISGLAQRHPATLSGGQAQRVALARTLARRPRVLLLDEPLAHIESAIREDIHRELISQVHRLGLSLLYVTHDITDACLVADRIIVLDEGRVVQQGTPGELFLRPQTREVARLMGVANILSAHQTGALIPADVIAGQGDFVAVVPTQIALNGTDDKNVVNSVGQIIGCVFARSHYVVQVETEIGTLVVWTQQAWRIGEHCNVVVTYAWAFADTERNTKKLK
ncbi:ABC transporter ATP-binding protein [Arcanobacterium phocae]|uniref:ABC transporter ATP-binding protein n=1 Tax=Arcanobacterium phocae TaxID=131112 RepID=UPI001C0EE120|nr:ABC transporter ATP-binding protein [Arcanobacterium phocae]